MAGFKAQNFQFTTKNFRSTKVQIFTKAAILANEQIAVAGYIPIKFNESVQLTKNLDSKRLKCTCYRY